MGMLIRFAGPPSWRDQMNRAIKIASARYCTVFLKTIQGPVTLPLLIFFFPLFGIDNWLSIY
jgi:hypothetical protein